MKTFDDLTSTPGDHLVYMVLFQRPYGTVVEKFRLRVNCMYGRDHMIGPVALVSGRLNISSITESLLKQFNYNEKQLYKHTCMTNEQCRIYFVSCTTKIIQGLVCNCSIKLNTVAAGMWFPHTCL